MAEEPQQLEVIELLGAPVSFFTRTSLVQYFERCVDRAEPMLVMHRNLHGAYLQRRQPEYSEHLRAADMVYADGMPFVWLARSCGVDVGSQDRTTYLDWEDGFFQTATTRGWRVFFVGGTPDALAQGLASLRAQYPDVPVDGVDGYFDQTPGGEANRAVIAAANAFDATVVFVGMGMPIQERWAAATRSQLQAPLVITFGAGLDYRSGVAKVPPRWLGDLGLEWLGRLAADPGRLWKRYLYEPLFVLGPALADLRRHRGRGSLNGSSQAG
jgi:N-acetylglucosaminyldiphosphoundecaprenol N-acetyl-beta-D-mannosaminyltransferase